MKYVTIVNAQDIELERHPLNGDEHYNETLDYAAKITAEAWNRDHPEDGWKVVEIGDEAEI